VRPHQSHKLGTPLEVLAFVAVLGVPRQFYSGATEGPLPHDRVMPSATPRTVVCLPISLLAQ
jgi:hypothetical protein